jgi:hypothetical protein
MRGALIRTAVSPSGFKVEWHRVHGTYEGAQPLYVILPRRSPNRTRYVPGHLEEHARIIFDAFAQDILDPQEVNDRLRHLRRSDSPSANARKSPPSEAED